MRRVFHPSTPDVDRYLLRSTHEQRLINWLGLETVEAISYSMRNGGGVGNPYPGPPVAIAGVPGRVYACGDGSFCGPIKGGYYGTMFDYAYYRIKKAIREACAQADYTFSAGPFTGLSHILASLSNPSKKTTLQYEKVGVAAPAVGASQSLRRQGTRPTAGAIAAGPPGGTVFTDASAGGFPFVNPAGGEFTNFINWFNKQSTAQNSSLQLMDSLFGVSPNYNSVAAQAITGVPTRYATAALAPGNILNADVTTALAAVASNVTITYVDDAGNAAEAGAAQALRISSAAGTSPFTAPQWFYNLNAGDQGVQKMTSFILSVAVNPGAVDRMISHLIAIMPAVGIATQLFIIDGINSAANMERIYDDACLTLWEWDKSATAASTHSGIITLAST